MKHSTMIFLLIASVLIGFYSGINSFLTNNKIIAVIDDGKTKNRFVWVPVEFEGTCNFKDFSSEDKKKFIEAMDNKDFETQSKLMRKYIKKQSENAKRY